MLSRRRFAISLGLVPSLHEFALAQRALPMRMSESGVLLNANENPDGPPRASLDAMREVLPVSWRYHYPEFPAFYATVARSEGLDPGQVFVGAGSSAILHAAIDEFTGPSRPLIYVEPTFELPAGIAQAFGRAVIPVPQTPAYAADVKRIAAEADKAGGGLIYLCNPNNPTSAITPKGDLEWLVTHLPKNTIALIDEAYIHFSSDPELESAIRYVKEGREVIVTRTFSKIYGMAGLRAGFGCAKPEYIRRMASSNRNVISIVTARSVLAALADPSVVPERRARVERIRGSLCKWLDELGTRYIKPHANFVMIDVKRDVRQFLPLMFERGVAPGRPFPPMNNMMRVSIGTEADMEKFRAAFADAMKA